MKGRSVAVPNQIDKVLTTTPPTMTLVYVLDPAWAELRAMRERRFYQVPTTPFNRMGRPPSFMRALAIQWLAKRFYPERFPWDREAETRAFYKLFLGVEPSDGQLAQILAGS